MFETCKYSQSLHDPIPQVKPQASSFRVCGLLQNILSFASKCISKCTPTIYYRFRDHFPCYGGVIISCSNGLSWGGGVCLGSENANSSRGIQGHAPPGKF